MSKKKPVDASDEEAVARAEERIELEQKLRDEALADLLSTPKGRDLYWFWMGQTGVFETSFNTNALTMAKNEGMRNFGLMLLTDLHRVAPEKYTLMVQEQEKKDG